MKWINELNTTSFRIVSTVGLIYLTGLRYMLSGVGFVKDGPHLDAWKPDWMWLVFLLTLAGVEGALLVAKRLTDYEYKRIAANATQPIVNAETATVQASGDVKVEAKPADDGAVG